MDDDVSMILTESGDQGTLNLNLRMLSPEEHKDIRTQLALLENDVDVEIVFIDNDTIQAHVCGEYWAMRSAMIKLLRLGRNRPLWQDGLHYLTR